jgi:hypothetical protein
VTYPDLSPSIALKREFLAVDVTVHVTILSWVCSLSFVIAYTVRKGAPVIEIP